jgi:hypothetical protein
MFKIITSFGWTGPAAGPAPYAITGASGILRVVFKTWFNSATSRRVSWEMSLTILCIFSADAAWVNDAAGNDSLLPVGIQ